MISKSETRPLSIPGALFFLAVFSAFCVVGTMDYEDEILQSEVNCASATFANDNQDMCGVDYVN